MSDPLSPLSALNFRTVLRDARLRAGFTKADVARRLHCTPAFIGAIEDRQTFPTDTRCQQLASVFGLDAKALTSAVLAAQAAAASAKVIARAHRRAERYRSSGV